MIKYFLYTIVALSLFTFNSCEPKLNLNADYTTTPIVFGLLDHADSIHYIKITKTFLGQGNNYEYAKIADSSYFNQVDAQIIELLNDVETGRVWTLRDSTIPNKDDGVFYNPSQKVYVFYEENLLEDHTYKLVADLDEGKYQIDASTKLINGFTHSSTSGKINMATKVNNESKYNGVTIGYTEGLNAKRFQSKMLINYVETLDGVSTIKQLIWSASTYNGYTDEDINPDKQNQSTVRFNGEQFYSFIRDNMEKNTSSKIYKREILSLQIKTSMGHTDFVEYLNLSKPSGSIAQSVPLYSNITNGLGLFSSRHTAYIEYLELFSSSMVELVQGPITGEYGFCSNLDAHTNEDFYCSE